MKKQIIKEAPVDYSDVGDSRMNQDIESKVSRKQTDLSDNPALPNLKNDKYNSFEELLASKSFKRVVNNLSRYTGITAHESELYPIQTTLMQAVMKLQKLEKKHRKRLQQIAVDLVKEEMGISDDEIEFHATLVDIGSFDLSDIDKMSEEEQMEIEEKLFDKYETLDLEVQKRRMINSMTQGASVKMQNMFHLVKDKLDEINPDLLDLYGIMMSTNDSMYWLLDDVTIDMLGGNDSSAAKMEVEPEGGSNGIPLVIAKAINFPTLIHELVKGVMEVYSLHGQHEDIEVTTAAIQLADSLQQEKWDLRLGPAIWETFREMYPDELFEEDKKYLEKYLIIQLYKLPAEQFNAAMKNILLQKPEGKKFLKDLLSDAVDYLNDYHNEE